jgi:glutaredoxin
MRKRLAILVQALCVLLASMAGACDRAEDTAASEELPPLTVTDTTPNLLFTWIDERGGTHTAMALSEIPAEARQHPVRVVAPEAGHGAAFYVVDLSTKAPDGSYPVRSMPRYEWEALIAERRNAARVREEPPPDPSAPPDPAPPGTEANGDLVAIIYGAAWCGPCHEAAAFLKSRGVKVVEYDVEREPARAREMQTKLERSGKRGGTIPVIDVAGTILLGYSRSALERALKSAARRDPM